MAVGPPLDPGRQSWADILAAWSGLFSKKSFFPYHRCDHCRLLYDPVYFTEAQLKELYERMQPNMAEAGSPEPLRQTQEGYFAYLAALVRPGGGYLELGPDIGTFARRCSNSVHIDRFWLIEPNLGVWSELKAALSGVPTRVSAGLDAIDAIPDGSLKIVVAIHVLDHLLNPADTLRRIRPKMAPDGVFLSVTHNERSVLARLLGTRWPPYSLQHPQLYNAKTVGELFQHSGFTPIKVVRTYNHFPTGFLIRQALWALLRIPIEKLGFLESISVRLRLGNIAAIALPKTGP